MCIRGANQARKTSFGFFGTLTFAYFILFKFWSSLSILPRQLKH